MKPIIKLISYSILFLSLTLLAEYAPIFEKSKEEIQQSFQNNYLETYKRLKRSLQTFVDKNKDFTIGEVFHENKFGLNDNNTQNGVAFFIYKNDSLIYWSNNAIPVKTVISKSKRQVVRLLNGWYQYTIHEEDDRTYVATQLIKHEYSYQNKYLQDDFFEGFGIDNNLGIEIVEENDEYKISSAENGVVFSLAFDPFDHNQTGFGLFLSLLGLFGLAICCLLITKHFCLKIAQISEGISIILFFASIALFRYLLIEYKIPTGLYSLDIFQPHVYAFTFWFPSLGDLLFNAVMILYGVFLVYAEKFKSRVNVTERLIASFMKTTIYLLILLCFSWFITDLFKSLIMDSKISFDISNFTEINEYSVLGLLGIALLNFAFFLSCHRILARIVEMNLSQQKLLTSAFIALSLFVVYHHFNGYRDLLLVLWSLPIIGLTYYWRTTSNRSYSLYNIIAIVFLFVLPSSYTLLKYTTNNEHEAREALAEKLSEEKDPITEYRLRSIGSELVKDKFLMSELASGECKTIDMEYYLSENFFVELLSRYEMQVTLGYPNDTLLTYFNDSIIGVSEKITDHFYLHENDAGRTSYCALIRFNQNPDSLISVPSLFIDLSSKYITTNIGFPELLLNGRVKTDIQNYNYAKYKYNRLVTQFGEYPYGLVPDEFIDSSMVSTYVDYEGLNHLVYRPNADGLIVLGKQIDRRLRPFTTFSYLFLFFALVLIVSLGANKILIGENPFIFSFKSRILFMLLSMSFATVVIVASASIYYLQDQFQKKNQKTLNEKLSSIIIELEEHLDYAETYKDLDPEFVQRVLIRRGNVFFTDINLFSKSGDLIGTSRKEIFEEGFISKKMNTNALHNMVLHFKNNFFQEEQIGGLRYLSTYTPILGVNNEPKAFVNLPYFAKQDMLESEISNFLATLFNVYVLLLMISILISILVSNTVSNPLRILKEKMMNIELGKSNEEIAWHVDDEIGSLIKEYNRMINELGQSAELLAKSEREFAWREMAKQVAHEIKNPLTPMKLNVQQLKRSWDGNGEDWDERLSKFERNMVEQIDSLANIASEFSNFAQMPTAQHVQINVGEVISDVLYLYKDTEGVKFELEKQGEKGEMMVVADKDQLNRVFTNLIKNSIQSFKGTASNRIDIKLLKKENSIIIEVKDNGCGIQDTEREKIFTPNFTTKTSGMGLGLAMVKNIIESANGRIWFESEINVGTKFFISLPSVDMK
ncbi:MAG: GHKL domain-containing protein [Flavobacteriales bacterium]|nr:GHKL domain-containing protein [Flavobacteriales bacterium]